MRKKSKNDVTNISTLSKANGTEPTNLNAHLILSLNMQQMYNNNSIILR